MDKAMRITLLSLALVLIPRVGYSDPPYGSDAPDSFDTAVLIDPSPPGVMYAGWYGDFPYVQPDLDYYKFVVAAGQSFRITCAQSANGSSNSQYPCVAALFNPGGGLHGIGDSSNGFTTKWAVEDAVPGEWRLEVAGSDVITFATVSVPDPSYYFDLALTPPSPATNADASARPGEVGEAGGSSDVSFLLLALGAFRRRLSAKRASAIRLGRDAMKPCLRSCEAE